MLDLLHASFPHLERAFVAELRRLKDNDPLRPLVVTAPSRRLLARLQSLALAAFPRGLANVHFLTFLTLARRLVPTAVLEADSLVHRVAIAHILRERLSQSPRLGSICEYPGLVDVLYQGVRDLQDALVDPVEGVRAVEEGAYAGEDAEVLAEMFLLQLCYREMFERDGTLDEAGVLAAAAEAAASSPWVGSIHAFLCYGFYDMTGAQEAFLGALHRCADVRCFVPCVKDDPAYAFAQPFLARLLGAAREVHDVGGPRGAPPAIRLVHASGIGDEAWRTAKEVLRWMEEEQIPPEEIAVIARSLTGGYGEALAAALRDHAIPFVSAWGRPLFSHPLAKAVAQVIGLEEDGYTRRAVIELVSSPFFAGDAGRTDQWDLLSRRLGIRGGREAWRRRMAQVAGKPVRLARRDEDDVRSEKIAAAEVDRFRERVTRLLDALQSVPARARWGAFADAYAAALDRIFDVADGEDADRAAWRLILDTLDRLRECDRVGGEATHRFFAETFHRALESATLEDPGRDASGVRILDAMAARGLSFRVVFVVGMNERVFPRAIHEEPFLRDRLRRKLNEVPGGALPEKLRGFDEERLLFRMLEESAECALTFSYQRSDENGRALIPSLYLRPQLTLAAEGKLVRESVPLGVRKRLQSVPWMVLTPREAGILLPLTGRSARALLTACGRKSGDLDHALAAMAAIDRFGALTPYDGMVGDMGAFWSALAQRGLSPTALESFARCPFQFFAKHVLHLEPLVDPQNVSELAPADQGTLVHAILEHAVQAIRAAGGYESHATTDAAPFLHDAARVEFEKFASEQAVGFPLLWQARRRVLLRALEGYLKADMARAREDHYVPLYFEADGQAEMTAGAERVRFHGKMDRLEVNAGPDGVAFRVRDYKSGHVPVELKSGKLLTQVQKGKRLQLPVYLMIGHAFLTAEANARGWSKDKIRPAGAVYEYLGLDGSERKCFDLPGEFWESDEAKATLASIRLFADAIRAGRFFIHPSGDRWGHCANCDFGAICRKEHIPSARRAEEDPGAQAYRDAVKG